jgi:hypothetical protein
MNYSFIRKIGDFLMLNSLQAHVNNLNNQNDKKRKVSKRYQDIFDRGCLFLDGSTTHPVIKPFKEVLKIHPSTNIADIIHLFFTKKQIRQKGDLPYPKIIKNAKSYQRGGEGGLSPLNISNSRRNIYNYKLSNSELSYIVKLAKHKIYSCAYEDEAEIYKKMCNVNNRCDSSDGDVVKYIDSGVVINNKIKINGTDITLDGYKEDDPEIQNMQYLVLENTDELDFVDFKTYIDKNRSTQTNIFKVFNKIMLVIKKYNNEFGFFHGDLHTSNVKVKVKVDKRNGNSLNIKVKLFDFDFAGILNPLKSQSPTSENAIISSNIMAYKLTDSNKKEIFQRSTKTESQSCEKVVMNKEYEYEYIKNFMYVFDYYRLLFSTLLELQIEPKNAKSISTQDIAPSDIVDKVYFENIINWYSQQKDIVWKDCFRKSAFCINIYEQAQVNNQTPQQQTCKKCENISPKIEEFRNNFLERCKKGNISKCTSNASSNFGSSPANTILLEDEKY